MLDKIARRMTPEEFYAWQEPMDEKYELVDGYPVKMMTGASRRHDQIVVSLIAALGNQLRGGPCRGFTSDTAVRTVGRTRRRPDAGIECGPITDESYEAGEVRLVAEVLSPSTREFDLFGKLDEYKSVETMDYVLFIEPNAPEAILWSRGNDRTWSHAIFHGVDASIDVKALGINLKLGELYEGLEFRLIPRLVSGGES